MQRRRLLAIAGAWALPRADARAQTHAPLNESEPAPVLAPRYLLQGPGGRAITSEDFRGRFQLLAFGFTGCASVCPTTLQEQKEVLEGLGDDARHLHALFITVDPARDTPAVLEAYTAAFDRRILGLRGSEALTRHAADAFKVRYATVREPGAAPDVYTMDHSAGMIVLGPDGRWLGRFGYGMSVGQMVERLRTWFGQAGF